MPLDPGLAGRIFEPTPPYLVSREKIAEFNASIGAEPIADGTTAPLTFPIVVAFHAISALIADTSVGIELRNLVHGDQRFEQTRPLRAGDVVTATLTVDGVRAAAGMDMITTSTDISTTDGEHLVTAHALLLHRDGNP